MTAEMKKDLRLLKKQQARDALVSSALHLFIKDGFDATTVDEIADLAVVSRRTFFRYFESKEDVLVAWMDDIRLRIQEDLKTRLETTEPFAAVKAAMMQNAEVLLADIDRTIALARLSYQTPSINSLNAHKYARWEKGFAEILSKGKSSSKAQLEARMLAARAVAAQRISIDLWVEGGFKSDIRALFERAFQMAKEPLQ
jgi:AcrR family transcriptional regulator